MLLTHLFEAGITAWNVDPDLDRNEAEMVSKFHGYDREMKHFSTKEKRLIRDPAHVRKIGNAFRRSPVPFSFYFWQTREPNYDKTAFKGAVDEAWLRKMLGDTSADAILAQTSPESITIVMTNNLSDENKISLSSGWIMAHRIGHAIIGDAPQEKAYRVRVLFTTFLKRILQAGYGLSWPDENSHNGRIFARDYKDVYSTVMGHAVGSMKSARDGTLVQGVEWWFETFAEFIIKGRITLRPLPEHFDDGLQTLTTDPAARKAVMKAWAMLPSRLEAAMTEMLREATGQVFVI